MKRLLILSGKGGTGKTTIASACVKLLSSQSYADCDVDAPNLHITVPPKGEFVAKRVLGEQKAEILEDKCIACGKCFEVCRFNAIQNDRGTMKVDAFACEGCKLCDYVCPVHAVKMVNHFNGITYQYQEEAPYFSTASLMMGEGSSGKLVSKVKKNMKEVSDTIAVIDGSPGIGCPVIASITGTDFVLVVTEPSVSGISDLKRIIKTIQYFKVPCAICINKYDINERMTEQIEQFCAEEQLVVIGKVPYDKTVSDAINEGRSIVSYDTSASKAIANIILKLKHFIS